MAELLIGFMTGLAMTYMVWPMDTELKQHEIDEIYLRNKKEVWSK